jgi:hypothetical protein
MASGNFYIIYIVRKPDVTYDNVREKMNLANSWYRISETLWILRTTSDAQRWNERLSPLVKDEGSLFVCKLDETDRFGWMNKRFWSWFREQGAVD